MNKETKMIECKICGKMFLRGKGGRPTNAKTCSEECSKELKRIANVKKQRKYANVDNTRKCIVCGKEFLTKGATKTCSEECRVENKKVYDRKISKQKYRERVGIVEPKRCKICNKEIVSESRGAKYCGECGNIAYRTYQRDYKRKMRGSKVQ